MKKELNYKEAFTKLETLVQELENGDIALDQLASKVKQANELISICDKKLKKIESDIQNLKSDHPSE